MAGVNQVIMLSLSTVVTAALAEGLGESVVTGLGQPDDPASYVGGIGILIIAISCWIAFPRSRKRRDTAKKTA